jgi:hypothetical protein
MVQADWRSRAPFLRIDQRHHDAGLEQLRIDEVIG